MPKKDKVLEGDWFGRREEVTKKVGKDTDADLELPKLHSVPDREREEAEERADRKLKEILEKTKTGSDE